MLTLLFIDLVCVFVAAKTVATLRHRREKVWFTVKWSYPTCEHLFCWRYCFNHLNCKVL